MVNYIKVPRNRTARLTRPIPTFNFNAGITVTHFQNVGLDPLRLRRVLSLHLRDARIRFLCVIGVSEFCPAANQLRSVAVCAGIQTLVVPDQFPLLAPSTATATGLLFDRGFGSANCRRGAVAPMNLPLGQLSGSDATDRLRQTIEEHQQASSRQTRHLIILTWAIVFLTLIMLGGLGVQIWLAWPS